MKNTGVFVTNLNLFCHLKGHPLWVSHKQDWGQGFILLLPQGTLVPESDAGSDGVKPALGFVIQNC